MAITIGLDFGTHQTKICIENSDTPTHKTYEFYDWGGGKFALPSIIQINADHTLRYGSVDMSDCLIGQKKKIVEKPEDFQLPSRPKSPEQAMPGEPILPPEPTITLISDNGIKITMSLSKIVGINHSYSKHEKSQLIEVWEKKCKKLKEEYRNHLRDWIKMGQDKQGKPMPVAPVLPPKPEFNSPVIGATQKQQNEYHKWCKTCNELRNSHKKALEKYYSDMANYKKWLADWERECARAKRIYEIKIREYQKSLIKYPLIYRYFKQATFSSYSWDYEIRPEVLTVLYLSYVIFKLEERFGTNFSIQMGIPASESSFKKLKKFAVGYLIQAYRLVEDVFQNDFEKFLATPYEELLKLIPPFEYSDDLKEQYGIIVLPEAYASLRSLTANSRIPNGMSIMLDIGGGTTDISFFVINDKKEPQIYHFVSVPKGLNFFLEYEETKKSSSKDFSVKRELEDLPQEVFESAYHDFKKNIDGIIKKLTNFLHQDTILRGFQKNAFREAISNRPAIYTGGGCYDIRMREPILDFTDVKYIDKSILAIPNVVFEDTINVPYSILATAFGLSIQRLDDDIIVSKKEDLFAPYNLREQNNGWDAHREHGMYED